MRTISLLFHDVYVADPCESGFQSEGADRYKLPLRDLEAQLGGLARLRPDTPHLIGKLTDTVPAGEAPYLLTVDDGGVSYYTLLADRFETRGWRGHCFVSTGAIGTRGFLSASQIRELDARGHVIGSHSVSHPPRFNTCDRNRLRREWSHSRKILEDLLGREVTVASVPGGSYSRLVGQTAREAGFRVLFTSDPTTTSRDQDGMLVIGRFTIRRRHPANRAARLVGRTPWTRYGEWASWNAKGLIRPILGPLYVRAADWMLREPQRTHQCQRS
jgi:peptidoglycan/xylan/chitin deacetylase (PgdA/CDA1 family)